MKQNKHNIYAAGGMKTANFLILGNIMFWRVWGQRKKQEISWRMKHFIDIEFSTFVSQSEASWCFWHYWSGDVFFLSRKACRAIISVKRTMRHADFLGRRLLIDVSSRNPTHCIIITVSQTSKRKKSINAVLLAVEIV